jgi:hypothetical protein
MVRYGRFAMNEINQTGRPCRVDALTSRRSRVRVQDQHDPRPPRGPGCSRRTRSGGQAAQVVIAQAVEHQSDQLAGGGHHADVAAAPFADPVAGLSEPGPAETRCTASTAAQRTSVERPCSFIASDPRTWFLALRRSASARRQRIMPGNLRRIGSSTAVCRRALTCTRQSGARGDPDRSPTARWQGSGCRRRCIPKYEYSLH